MFSYSTRKIKKNRKIFGGWISIFLFILFSLFFFHVNPFIIFGFGLMSFLPFGFFFFFERNGKNNSFLPDDKTTTLITPQKSFQNQDRAKIEENGAIKKTTTIKNDISKDKEIINDYFNKSNEENVPNIRDLHTITFDEALKNGVIIKSVELEKVAAKNNIKVDALFGLNLWLSDRLSLDKESILLVNGEKIAISDTKNIEINIDEMRDEIKENTLDEDVDLSENIQNELDLTSEELVVISKDMKNVVETEKNILKENTNNANLHNHKM